MDTNNSKNLSFAEKKVSIIVLNWNRLKDTVECLESIRQSDYTNYEIIVVDNASSDGSPKVIKEQFPGVIVIENKENTGFTGGNNIGIRRALECKADYVWLLNNDAVIKKDTIRILVQSLESDPRIGMASPLIYFYANADKLQFCGAFFDNKDYRIRHLKELKEINALPEKDICLWGTALFIRREVIEKIGVFNEKYFAYHEDAEYSRRVIKGGYINHIEVSTIIYHKAHYHDQLGDRAFPPYVYFYMVRNWYWLWNDTISGFKKVTFLRSYLTSSLGTIGDCKAISYDGAISACFDGMYAAFHNKGGKYVGPQKGSTFLRKLILKHPYFWAYLLDLKFKDLVMRAYGRKKGMGGGSNF